MSALTEALATAQARALAALEKAYVAGAFEDDRMREQLDAIGCTDAVDQGQLIECLDTLRAYGAPAPTYSERRNTDTPTQAQKDLVASIAKAKELVPPDLAGATRAQVSELIDAMKNGSYDPAAWTVPF